jgi:hypothetical protein
MLVPLFVIALAVSLFTNKWLPVASFLVFAVFLVIAEAIAAGT